MSLKEDLDSEYRKMSQGVPCLLCDFIRSLTSQEDAQALTKFASQGATISDRGLHRVLVKHDAGVGIATISRHRKENHRP